MNKNDPKGSGSKHSYTSIFVPTLNADPWNLVYFYLPWFYHDLRGFTTRLYPPDGEKEEKEEEGEGKGQKEWWWRIVSKRRIMVQVKSRSEWK